MTLVIDKVRTGQMAAHEAAMCLDIASNLNKAARKNQGVTYTPWEITYKIVEQTAPKYNEKWLDTSVGRGMFLWATLSFLEAQGANAKQLQYFLDHGLHAVELDVQAAKDCTAILSAWCANRGLTPPQRPWLIQGDSLLQKLPHVDVMVGNPPYVRIQNLDDATRAVIRQQYNSCAQGNVDLYYAFFEQALRQARRGAIIAPNSWLTNNSATILRRLLAVRTTKVLDFYSTLLFAPVRAYTAIWIWDEPTQCPAFIIRQEGWDKTTAIAQPRQPLLNSMGLSWPDPLRIVVPQSSSTMVALHTLAQVRSGIATLSDKVYTVELVSHNHTADTWMCTMYTGEQLNLHASMLAPLYKWTKYTQANGLQPGARAIIYPYDKTGNVLTPTDIKAYCSNTWNYLTRQKNILSQRDKGKGKYDQWYAYGRKQGLYTQHSRALGIPTMWSGPCIPVQVNKAQMPYVFVSGFVLVPHDGVDINRLINALAHKDVWQQILAQGKIWAGNKPYRSVSAPMARVLKVPY